MYTLYNGISLGTIGLVLRYGDNEKAHIDDGVELIVRTLSALHVNENITSVPGDCNDQPDWPSGPIILK
jgi:hypothetical protein